MIKTIQLHIKNWRWTGKHPFRNASAALTTLLRCLTAEPSRSRFVANAVVVQCGLLSIRECGPKGRLSHRYCTQHGDASRMQVLALQQEGIQVQDVVWSDLFGALRTCATLQCLQKKLERSNMSHDIAPLTRWMPCLALLAASEEYGRNTVLKKSLASIPFACSLENMI